MNRITALRILLLSHSYPPVLGGLQTVSHHLAVGLANRRHAVQVVTNRYPSSLPEKEVLNGVPIRRLLFINPSFNYLKQQRLDLFLASFWFYPATLLKLEQLMKRFRPEIVNVHYPLSQIPFILALRKRYNFRLIVSLHGDDILPQVIDGHDNLSLRAVLRHADAVTTCSKWLLEQAANWEPTIRSKGIVIHNGVMLERFADRSSFKHPCPYFFAFGRLSYQKGFDLLLEAFARLAPQFPQLDLVLAGDGEEQDALLNQAKQMGLDGRVHFFGRAAPEQVVQLLNGCSFVVVPSRWEPFGIVALEGMAASKPILATNIGGMPEFLTRPDVNSLLVPATVDGMLKGLREMLENVGQNLLPKERKTNLSDFSWEHVVTRYEEVFGVYG